MKRTPKEIRKRTFITFGTGLAASLIGIALNEQVTLIMMGLLMMFASIIYHVIFYRCPYCDRYLGRSSGDYCPYCGQKVNE